MLKKKRNKSSKKKQEIKLKKIKNESEINEIKHLTNNIFELKNNVSFSIDGKVKMKLMLRKLNFNGYIYLKNKTQF